MKFNFKFSNLCGSVYKQGNIVFTPDGNSVLSPVGNRITVFDLVNHRCSTLPIENRKNIARIALAPNGTSLLSVDEDGHAVYINLLKQVQVCEFHFKKGVLDIQFSPDSKWIAATHARHVQVWKSPPLVTSFRPFALHRTYTGHYDDVTVIRWAPCSSFFLTGSKDFTVRMYSLHSMKDFSPLVLTGHREKVLGIFFGVSVNAEDLDTTNLYTVSRDGSLFHWKFEPNEVDSDAEGEEEEGGESTAQTHGYHKKRKQLAGRVVRGKAAVYGADNPLLACGRFTLHKKHYLEHNHSKVVSVAFHRTSGIVVVGLASGVFQLYELPECTLIHSLSIGQKKITAACVNQSGDWLAFGSAALGQLLVWEWKSETYVLKQQGHFFDLNTIAYSPDGQLIATGGDDGKVKIWNTTTGFCFVTFAEHTSPVHNVVFSSTGTVVLSSSLDGTVRAYDLVRYRNFRTMTSPTPAQFHSLTLDPAGEVVCAGALEPPEVYVWALQTGRLLDVFAGHEGPVVALSLANSQGILASASWDKTVRLWDVFNGQGAIESLSHNAEVLALAFRPDGNEICSAAMDGNLYLWDYQEGVLKGTIDGKKDIMGGRLADSARASNNSTHSYFFNSVCYSADGSCVVAGGNCKYVCIYELSNKVLLQKFVISNNLSLDGMQSFLNSRHMGDAGNALTIDDDDSASDYEDRIDSSLPGAKTGEFSARQKRIIMRTKCVRFSPTGLQWAAACTEGLLIYSLDDSLSFAPSDLDMDTTPENVAMCLTQHKYAQALTMALSLNEGPLLEEVLVGVPYDEVGVVASSVPAVRVQRLLEVLARLLDESPHVAFWISWTLNLLSEHGAALKKNSTKMLRTFRAVQKSLGRHTKDLSHICNENLYLLQYLSSFPKHRAPCVTGEGEDTGAEVVEVAEVAEGDVDEDGDDDEEEEESEEEESEAESEEEPAPAPKAKAKAAGKARAAGKKAPREGGKSKAAGPAQEPKKKARSKGPAVTPASKKPRRA